MSHSFGGPLWTNHLGSLTIIEPGGGRCGENCKTAEIILVFSDPEAYSD